MITFFTHVLEFIKVILHVHYTINISYIHMYYTFNSMLAKSTVLSSSNVEMLTIQSFKAGSHKWCLVSCQCVVLYTHMLPSCHQRQCEYRRWIYFYVAFDQSGFRILSQCNGRNTKLCVIIWNLSLELLTLLLGFLDSWMSCFAKLAM